jgi:hypothetical protein
MQVDTQASEFAKLNILDRLAQVESKLKENDPLLGQHMTSIHKELLAHEELVHILKPEQIGILMAGMQKYKQLQIVEAVSKSKGKRVKETEDDF